MDEPDREEKCIRFGCGAAFGFVVAGLLLLKLGGPSWPWCLVAAGACGYVALRDGDEFWWSTLEDRWWWMP